MKYNMRYIGLIWIFFSVCLLACVDETSEVTGGKSGELEQVVLKLNVQEESLVRTRAVTEPDDTEKIGSIDFFIFNAAGQVVVHEQPAVKWTGTEYKMMVGIPSASGEHTLYMVANYPMAKGTIKTLQDLENQVSTSEEASVSSLFVMATQKITLSALNATTISNALSSNGVDGKINLKRNVAKFSVGVTATNFKLNYVEWKNCPTSAPLLLEKRYVSPETKSVNGSSTDSSPDYLYQIQDIGADAHKGFHVLVGGEYTAKDGTTTTGYYKLRLYTVNGSGVKTPLASIDANSYYKIDIRSVSGTGAGSPEKAEMNGFSNDMEALTILDFTTYRTYRETYLQNGYQLGLSNSSWKIYDSRRLNYYPIGDFYRTIRDASLKNNTTLDPDYPDKDRGVVIARERGTNPLITGMKECTDTPNSPIEMELFFIDLAGMEGKEYTFTSVIQYGVLQKSITIDRYPSVNSTYSVLAMPNTSYGEVVLGSSWVGLAAQRHEGTTLYKQLDSDNNYIFIHVLANNTGSSRTATVQLFGNNGYSQIIIRQEAN